MRKVIETLLRILRIHKKQYITYQRRAVDPLESMVKMYKRQPSIRVLFLLRNTTNGLPKLKLKR